jgi:hypothetical protein
MSKFLNGQHRRVKENGKNRIWRHFRCMVLAHGQLDKNLRYISKGVQQGAEA